MSKAPIGIVCANKLKCSIDYSNIKNVPSFADKDETSANIINEVNRAKTAESNLDQKIDVLRSEIMDAFGGNLSEIKAVYGNIQAVEHSFDSINEILAFQPVVQNQILTSRLNNLEQVMLSLKR
jgi:uncharacterized membrane protein YheB (UPF0754 family)